MSVHEPDVAMARATSAQHSPVRAVLFFDAMITPKIITVVYWLMLFAVLMAGLAAMFAVGGFRGFLAGVFTIAGGALAARIWCELLIVLFKINEHTRRMAERP